MDNIIQKKIGYRIKKFRELNKLTQGKLAESIGLSRVSISNIENGKHPMNINSLYKLALKYDLSLDYFLPSLSDIKEENNKIEEERKRLFKGLSKKDIKTIESLYKNIKND